MMVALFLIVALAGPVASALTIAAGYRAHRRMVADLPSQVTRRH